MIESTASRKFGVDLDTASPSALDEHIEFERLIGDLAGQCMNLPSDRSAAAVRNGLGQVCGHVGVDRAVLYRIDQNLTMCESITGTAQGLPPLPSPIQETAVLPWTIERVLKGDVTSIPTLSNIPYETDRRTYAEMGVKSAVLVPLAIDGHVAGAVRFDALTTERLWPADLVQRLKVVAMILGQFLAQQQREAAMQAATAELQRLREQVQHEQGDFRQAGDRSGSTRVVGQSAAVRRVVQQIEQVANTDSTVLLLGETGTGKELFATQIHDLGPRRGRLMVRVNCAAIPATLIESELFGREKGAFTGALARQVGRFEMAHQSTIFLDEIGDLPSEVQVKLLRVLEERQIERLGSPRPITVDVRIIAATHRNLEQRIAEGAFREDLYYRLNVFPINVPPLRERAEDIPLLIWRFVEEFSKSFGKRIESIDKNNLAALQQYSWPGNIRELRNVVERAMIASNSRRLNIALPPTSAAASRRSSRLFDVEKEHIRSVLESTGWRIRGASGAADRLGLKPTTLETRMVKLGLRRPGHA